MKNPIIAFYNSWWVKYRSIKNFKKSLKQKINFDI